MFVHCFNPECKQLAQCRKPAFTFSEAFHFAQIRSGTERHACADCGSSFVDRSQELCFACSAAQNPGPHKIVLSKVVCGECKKEMCRPLKDFSLNEDDEEECICCGDDIEAGAIKGSFKPCGHAACPECFLISIENQIKTRKIVEKANTGEYTVKCFAGDCSSLLQSNQCISLLSERTRNMFVRFATEEVVKGELHGEICPFPDCNDAIIELPDEESSMVVTCLSCERRFCRCCKKESRTGKCPQEENEEEARLLEKSGITPCPNCKVNIFRNKGCNRVFCTNCKKNFCWICLKLTGHENRDPLTKYSHWRKLIGGCPLWGGKRKVAKQKAEKKSSKASPRKKSGQKTAAKAPPIPPRAQ